jgi:hypothetical protein
VSEVCYKCFREFCCGAVQTSGNLSEVIQSRGGCQMSFGEILSDETTVAAKR